MNPKHFLILVIFVPTIFAHKYTCSRRSATLLLKRSTYEFSLQILNRVSQETENHFVFSPLSTWLQLISLAEGAKGRTLRELWHITKHHRNKCFKIKLGQILHEMNRDLRFEYRRRSLVIIDKFMGVKRSFMKNVQRLYGTKTLLSDFTDQDESASIVNKIVQSSTSGKIQELVISDDFNNTVMLVGDALYFRNAWRYPFNAINTRREPFFSSGQFKTNLGYVDMMSQTGYFNVTEFPRVHAKVLEMPCADGRFSMLIFLPTRDYWIGDVLYSLRHTRLSPIFNRFKHEGPKLTQVKLPRFKLTTNVENIAELLYDMGVKRIFDPDLAEFGPISDFKLHVSLVTQVSDIEVTETGVRAQTAPDNYIADNKTVNFIANVPFAFMIVDRQTEFILFAGIYSSPSLY